MCGLAGMLTPSNIIDRMNEEQFETRSILFRLLFTLADERGGHAAGMAAINTDGETDMIKRCGTAAALLNSDAGEIWYAAREYTTAIIGHTRFATHHNSDDPMCAHPFQYGHITGAHNGILYGYHQILKEHSLKPVPVDSMAIFSMLEVYDPKYVHETLDGNMACVWYNAQTGDMNYSRVDNPLYIVCIPSLMNTLVWASTMDAIICGCTALNLKYQPIEMKNTSHISISSETGNLTGDQKLSVTYTPINWSNINYNQRQAADTRGYSNVGMRSDEIDAIFANSAYAKCESCDIRDLVVYDEETYINICELCYSEMYGI